MATHKDVAKITFLVTYTMFMTEAVFHYNLGVHKNSSEKKFVMPPKKDFIKLALITGLFSLLNGVVVNQIMKKK
jgi:hypothetical protein